MDHASLSKDEADTNPSARKVKDESNVILLEGSEDTPNKKNKDKFDAQSVEAQNCSLHILTGNATEESDTSPRQYENKFDASPVNNQEENDALTNEDKENTGAQMGKDKVGTTDPTGQAGDVSDMASGRVEDLSDASTVEDKEDTGREEDWSSVLTGNNQEKSDTSTRKVDNSQTLSNENGSHALIERCNENCDVHLENDEDMSDAPLLTDETDFNPPAGKVIETSNVAVVEGKEDTPNKKDKEEAHAQTGEAQNWSHSLTGNAAEESETPSRKYEKEFDASTVNDKDENNAFTKQDDKDTDAQTGKDKVGKNYPTGQAEEVSSERDEKWSNASTVKDKTDSDALTTKDEDEEYSDAQTRKDKEASHATVERDRENCNVETETDEEGSDILKYEEEYYPAAGTVNQESEVKGKEDTGGPIKNDDNESDASTVKDKKDTGRDEDWSSALTGNNQEKFDISTTKVDKSQTLSNEDCSHALIERCNENCDVKLKNDEDVSDTPLLTDETDFNPPAGKVIETSNVALVEGKEDIPNKKDKEESHAQTGEVAAGIVNQESEVEGKQDTGGPIKNDDNESDAQTGEDEEWSVVAKERDEEVCGAAPTKDKEWTEATIGQNEEVSDSPGGNIAMGCNTPKRRDEEGSGNTLTKAEECYDINNGNVTDTQNRKDEKDPDIPTIKDKVESVTPTRNNEIYFNPSTSKEEFNALHGKDKGPENEPNTSLRKDECSNDPTRKERNNVVPVKDTEKSDTLTRNLVKESNPPTRREEKDSDDQRIKEEEGCEFATGKDEQGPYATFGSDTVIGNIVKDAPTRVEEKYFDVQPAKVANQSDTQTAKEEGDSDVQTRNDGDECDGGGVDKVFDVTCGTDKDKYCSKPVKDEENLKNLPGKVKVESYTPFLKDEEWSDGPNRSSREDCSSRNYKEKSDDPTEINEKVFDTQSRAFKDTFYSLPVKNEEDSNSSSGKLEVVSDTSFRKYEEGSDNPKYVTPILTDKGFDAALIKEENRTDAPDEGFEVRSDTASGTCEENYLPPVKENSYSPTSNNDKEPDVLLGKNNEESDSPTIQQQLLQVLQSVSSGHNITVLQEVMDTLQSALVGDTHALASIKEESSEETALTQLPSQAFVSNMEELSSVQDYLECVGKLQDHADVLHDVKKDLLTLETSGGNLEELQIQIEEFQALGSQISILSSVLTADMEKAKLLLHAADGNIPTQIYQDLASIYMDLEHEFTAVAQMHGEMSQSLFQAMETRKAHLGSTYQKHLADLEGLADLIQKNLDMGDVDCNVCDVEELECWIQKSKEAERCLHQEAKLKLDDVTFDVQSFISEHALFLSPAQSRCLLRLLSSTQRAFRDQKDRLVALRCTLDVLFLTKEREEQEKVCLWICCAQFICWQFGMDLVLKCKSVKRGLLITLFFYTTVHDRLFYCEMSLYDIFISFFQYLMACFSMLL
ncbi:uncharacterized protein [Nerophis lumbriciformis]|uniref:uncharacterized protein n=1 Tax=Nerophis lumbriciformis TaxID=546530 RepID=UPI003BAB4951